MRMRVEVEETAEVVPVAGLGALGLGVAVVPVEQVVVEGAAALPTICPGSLRTYHHRSH
jgi:hypothetical protein